MFPSERDFGQAIIEPLLRQWGVQYQPEYPCIFYQGSRRVQGRVDYYIHDADGPLSLIEAKLSLARMVDLQDAIGQAKSYALHLGLSSFIVAAPEGVMIYSLVGPYEQPMQTIPISDLTARATELLGVLRDLRYGSVLPVPASTSSPPPPGPPSHAAGGGPTQSRASADTNCPRCHTPVQSGWKMCPHCGITLNAPSPQATLTRLICPACSAQLPLPPTDSRFLTCQYCGTNLEFHQAPAGPTLRLAQELHAQQTQLVRTQRETQLQILELQLENQRSQIMLLQGSSRSHARDQALATAYRQQTRLRAEAGALRAELYAETARTVPTGGVTGQSAGAGCGCFLWGIVAMYGFGLAVFGLGVFGLPLGILSAVFAYWSPEYRTWLQAQPGFRRRLARVPGFGGTNPSGLAFASFLWLEVLGLFTGVSVLNAVHDPPPSSAQMQTVPATLLILALGSLGIWILYGWFIAGWRVPDRQALRTPFPARAVCAALGRQPVAGALTIVALLLFVGWVALSVALPPGTRIAADWFLTPIPTRHPTP